MKIGIDASRAFREERTGTENYSYFLIQELLKRAQDYDYEFVLYSDIEPSWLVELPENVELRVVPGSFLWSQLRLAFAARKDGLDVFFVPSHVLPFLYSKNSVVTIHGLEYERYPKAYSFLNRLYLKLATNWALSKASVIITPSQFTAHDLGRTNGVEVIQHGGVLSQIESSGNSFEKLGDYFLCIGRLEERKNVSGILRAFSEYILQHNGSYRLVLAGKRTEYFDSIFEKLDDVVKEQIVLLGYIDDSALASLLSNAKALLYPSFAEGFGMPVLDSLQMRVPVITSRHSPMSELVGDDYPLLVDPRSVDSIVKAMLYVSEKGFSEQYLENMQNDVKHLTWGLSFKEHMRVLENLANRKGQ